MPRRFQIHLSTAVILMFAAGVFLWLNVRPRTSERNGDPIFDTDEELDILVGLRLKVAADHREFLQAHPKLDDALTRREFTQTKFGWPAPLSRRTKIMAAFESGYKSEFVASTPIKLRNVGVNIGTALAVLLVLWFICEWWIRRRAPKESV